MEKDRYDIFISYRRDGGFETAKHLNDLLVRDGYTVSFDIDTLREGDLDETLLRRIDQCVDFILVVNKHTFDRTLDPNFNSKNDWLRTELAYALKHKKNVIPVLLSGVNGFPLGLPSDISGITTKNGPEYNKYYFDEFYNRLKTFLHCNPRNSKNDNLFKRIHSSRRLSWLFLAFLLCFIGVFICYQAISPNKIILSVQDLPANLNYSGVTKDYIEDNATKFLPLIEGEANEKLKHFFSGYSIELSEFLKETKAFSDIQLNNIQIVSLENWLVKKVRKLLGKKDVFVELKLLETDSVCIGELNMIDWEGVSHDKSIKSSKKNFEKGLESQLCVIDIIEKSVWYIVFAYSPVISVLYDYENGYNGRWKDILYDEDDHVKIIESFLMKSIDKGWPDSLVCYLLLGDYLDNVIDKNKDFSKAQTANECYKHFSLASPRYSENVKRNLSRLEKIVCSEKLDNIPFILTERNIIQNNKCRQLIVVTNQEKEIVGKNEYFKAKLYLYEYEKKDGKWKMVESAFEVHVGKKGIADPEEKKEGDWKTPSGFYPISFAFGNQKDIETKMEFRQFKDYKEPVWVSDPSSEDYNLWVDDKEGIYNSETAEILSRIQPQYKYAIVIGYNMNPVEKNKGSAIFLHVQQAYNHGTAGCISMEESDIIYLLKWLDPTCMPHIYISKRINF